MPIQLTPALITKSSYAKTARVKLITQEAAKAIIVAYQTPSHSDGINTTRTVYFFRVKHKWGFVCRTGFKALKNKVILAQWCRGSCCL